jgi:hypothetical protein
VSAPWWHPEADPLGDIRRFMRAAELGVPVEDLERLEAALDDAALGDG